MDYNSGYNFSCDNISRSDLLSQVDVYANYVSKSFVYNLSLSSIFGLLSIGAVVGNSAAIYLLVTTRDTFVTGNAG